MRRTRGRSGNGHSNNGGGNQGGNRGRSQMPSRQQVFDSNGPDVRIRGNAWQVYEKYQTLARDAFVSGDRVRAESYLQHAEHYYRIVLAIQEATGESFQPRRAPGDEQQQDDQNDMQNDGGDMMQQQQQPQHQQMHQQPMQMQQPHQMQQAQVVQTQVQVQDPALMPQPVVEPIEPPRPQPENAVA